MIETRKKILIAELLIEKGIITQEQAKHAIKIHKNSDKKIGQILIEQGYIDEDTLLQLLSQQLGIPYISLKDYPFDVDLVQRLPEFYARHYRAIILNKENGFYLIGMVDPQNVLAKDEIQRLLKAKVKLALIKEQELLHRLDIIYRRKEEISLYAESLSHELEPSSISIPTTNYDISTQDLPVVNLLRSIFEDAVQMKASDIHIEPGNNLLYIRLRIDGVLQQQTIAEKDIIHAMVQRVKLMSGLNIAEKRLPQDGRFSFTAHEQTFDVRVSTIPTQYGESLVMRLLNQSDKLLVLDQIGMSENIYEFFTKVLRSTYGIILIVGPTGSGKTTTLYSSLNTLNSAEDKIITVEDPVEYRLKRINQIQVNSKIGLTFASVLRSILRQDPDIIMIGELRDQETVDIALRAAMTGHLVLATLHTNDSISAPSRLLDMGAEGYILASVLRTVLAQRLVRKNCLDCIEPETLDSQQLSWLKANGEAPENFTFKRGTGCSACHNSGYSGRVGVFEILPMSDDLIEAIRISDTSKFQKIASRQALYQPLVKTGIELAKKGITSVNEIIHMAGIV